MPAYAHQCKVLFVLTSTNTLGDTGEPTGYTVSEAADPWQVFVDAGWDVHVATIKGGPAPGDGFDPDDATQVAWTTDPHISRQLQSAPTPAHVNAAIYDAVYLVGGHGTMWDFVDNTDLDFLISGIYEHGGVVAAVCHGPAGLLSAVLVNGSRLIEGKNVTGFSNAEEKAVKKHDAVPFLLADRLTEAGANYSNAAKWQEHVVVDGRLVTGQNPQSAAAVARAVIELST